MEITPEFLKDIDTDDMLGKLEGFPSQWREAVDLTRDVSWPIDSSRIRNVCISGMGGSAIGADIIRTHSLDQCPVPVFVNRRYDLPQWVGAHTLFVACSFSGNTEETLHALQQAKSKNAQIVAVTSGGKLLLEASREDYGYVKIPGGMPPRAALAYSFVPLFQLFNYLGFTDEGADALEETAKMLEEQAIILSETLNNPALMIAREIQDTLPIIYTGSGLLESVGLRWRGQFEENSKVLSYGNSIPEMNHNEIVGWEQVAHLTGRLSVIMLEDEDDHPKEKQRMQIVKELVEELTVYSTQLKSFGNSRLARQFSLIQIGDWVSFYLALINEVDPTPIAKIDLLKSRLAEL